MVLDTLVKTADQAVRTPDCTGKGKKLVPTPLHQNPLKTQRRRRRLSLRKGSGEQDELANQSRTPERRRLKGEAEIHSTGISELRVFEKCQSYFQQQDIWSDI